MGIGEFQLPLGMLLFDPFFFWFLMFAVVLINAGIELFSRLRFVKLQSCKEMRQKLDLHCKYMCPKVFFNFNKVWSQCNSSQSLIINSFARFETAVYIWVYVCIYNFFFDLSIEIESLATGNYLILQGKKLNFAN